MADHPTTLAPDQSTVPRAADWSGPRNRPRQLGKWTDRAVGPPAFATAQPELTSPAASERSGGRLSAEPTTRPARGRWVDQADEAYALAVLAAPLIVAGWFQSHAVHARLGLPWAFAVAFTVAWEGAAGYTARLYVRALLRGDSTVILRLAMLAYAAVSCGLLWWHLQAQQKPWYLAAAVGGLTLSGIFLLARRARDRRRDDLYARGLVDAQVVKFGPASWVAAPLETVLATRYAIRHRISRPIEAMDAYRTARSVRRYAVALRRARKAMRKRSAQKPPKPTAAQVECVVALNAPEWPSTPDTRPADTPELPAEARPSLPAESDRTVHAEHVAPDRPVVRAGHGPTAVIDAAFLRATYGDDQQDAGFPGRNELMRRHGGNAGRWSGALRAHADRADQPSD